MNKYQWLLVVRFMFEVMYALNRLLKTYPEDGSSKLEYDLEKLYRSLEAE